MTGALWFLIRTTARNRLRRQLQRLRTPRYALAFVVGVAYFWFFFIRQGGGRPMAGDAGLVMLAMMALVAVGYLAWSWVFGTDRTALAFTPAEVALLFPAPISRRGLILYKLARSQLTVLVSVVVWSVLLNRGGDPLSSIQRAAGFWAAFTTLSLHRFGIGLSRAGIEEHGLAGLRRNWPVLLLFTVAFGLVAWTLWSHRDWVTNAADPRATLAAVVALTQLPPASYVLYPVQVAFGPVAAPDLAAWVPAFGQALLLIGLHVLWVLRSDTAFEEAAAEASARRAAWVAKARAQRSGGGWVRPKSVRRTLPLAPHGPPATAIVWKNALWVLRTGQVRGLLLPPVALLVAVLTLADEHDRSAWILVSLCGVFSAMLLLFGPATTRNDLRSDLLHLPMLKTLPIPGPLIVLAQVLSGALTVVVPQLLLGGVALTALLLSPSGMPIPPDLLLAGVLGAPALLLAVNAANFTVHNGVALLFPGWVRLGERGPTGFEATGQMMLTTVATLLALVVLLLLPAAGGAVAWFVLAAQRGTALLVSLTVGALLLAGEAWLMLRGLGRSFDRVEPSQVGAQ